MNINKCYMQDILSTAMEGGINYWCNALVVKHFPKKIENYEYVSDLIAEKDTIYEVTTIDNEKFELNQDRLIDGIDQAIRDLECPEIIEDFDANDSDNIIQYALFKELIYG